MTGVQCPILSLTIQVINYDCPAARPALESWASTRNSYDRRSCSQCTTLTCSAPESAEEPQSRFQCLKIAKKSLCLGVQLGVGSPSLAVSPSNTFISITLRLSSYSSIIPLLYIHFCICYFLRPFNSHSTLLDSVALLDLPFRQTPGQEHPS